MNYSKIKPQSIHIHLVFVAVITYIIGLAMANILPNKGKIGRRNSRAGRGMSPEEEGLLSAGATGADEGVAPQHRRRIMGDSDDNV